MYLSNTWTDIKLHKKIVCRATFRVIKHKYLYTEPFRMYD